MVIFNYITQNQYKNYVFCYPINGIIILSNKLLDIPIKDGIIIKYLVDLI